MDKEIRTFGMKDYAQRIKMDKGIKCICLLEDWYKDYETGDLMLRIKELRNWNKKLIDED